MYLLAEAADAAAHAPPGWVTALCAIDNLGKGASGQAVQCANLATGLPEGAELALLEPLRDQLRPEVFTEEAYALGTSNPDRAFDFAPPARSWAM